MKDKKLRQCEAICKNNMGTWKDLKQGKGKDHYSAHHVVAMTVVSTQSNSNILVAKYSIGSNYRFIQQAREHGQLLQSEVEGIKWVKIDRK